MVFQIQPLQQHYPRQQHYLQQYYVDHRPRLYPNNYNYQYGPNFNNYNNFHQYDPYFFNYHCYCHQYDPYSNYSKNYQGHDPNKVGGVFAQIGTCCSAFFSHKVRTGFPFSCPHFVDFPSGWGGFWSYQHSCVHSLSARTSGRLSAGFPRGREQLLFLRCSSRKA